MANSFSWAFILKILIKDLWTPFSYFLDKLCKGHISRVWVVYQIVEDPYFWSLWNKVEPDFVKNNRFSGGFIYDRKRVWFPNLFKIVSRENLSIQPRLYTWCTFCQILISSQRFRRQRWLQTYRHFCKNHFFEFRVPLNG